MSSHESNVFPLHLKPVLTLLSIHIIFCGESRQATTAGCARLQSDFLWADSPITRGGIAISPSSRLLAVWDMEIGIEWYSLADRKHLSTTTYQSLGRTGQRRVVRLVFVGEKTIAMGHVDGQVVIASWCCKRDPPQFSIQRNDKKRGCELLSAAIVNLF